jgi:hypothetical protein
MPGGLRQKQQHYGGKHPTISRPGVVVDDTTIWHGGTEEETETLLAGYLPHTLVHIVY